MLSLRLQCLQERLRGLLSVPLRIVLCPAPEIRTCLFKSVRSLPAEFLVRTGRVRCEIQNVTSPACNHLVRKIAANCCAEGFDHVVHGAAFSGSEIPCAHTWVLLAEVIEGNQVPRGEIENVDVVADGSAIFRGVVYFPC